MDTLPQPYAGTSYHDHAFERPWQDVRSSSKSPRSLASLELEHLQAVTDSAVEKAGFYEAEVVRIHNQLANAFGLGAPVQHFNELGQSNEHSSQEEITSPAQSQSPLRGVRDVGSNPHLTAAPPILIDVEAQRRAIERFEPCSNLRLRIGLQASDKDFVSQAVDKQLSTTFRNGVSEYVRKTLLEYVGRLPLDDLQEIGISHAGRCFRKVSKAKQSERRSLLEHGAVEAEQEDDGFIGGLKQVLGQRLAQHSITGSDTSVNIPTHMAHKANGNMSSRISQPHLHRTVSTTLANHQSGYTTESFGSLADVDSTDVDGGMTPSLRTRRRRVAAAESQSRSLVKSFRGPPFKADAFSRHQTSSAAMLRWRELGGGFLDSRRVYPDHIHRQLRFKVLQELRPWREWGKAAKDVLTTAWSPSGRHFAIGATSDLDPNNIQYNNRGTLLYGDIETNELRELDDHKISRFRAESGANALQDTINTLDPYLYTTVTGICFDEVHDVMCTSSYDKTLKIWDLSEPTPVCKQTFHHQNSIEVLDCASTPGCLATIQARRDDAVTLFRIQHGTAREIVKFGTDRASKSLFTPTCLQFGKIARTNHLLLAGFSEYNNEWGVKDRDGELCLWNVGSSDISRLKLVSTNRAVHDAVWSPHGPYFAAAVAVDLGNVGAHRSGIHSHIRTWNPLDGPQKVYEFDCPALDINELRFHPFDPNIVTASCTDGITYVWDARKIEYDRYIARLEHGDPLDTMDETVIRALGYSRAREELDTGVKLAAWDREGKCLYTGSSDGVVKQWNPWVAEEDAFVRDVMVASSVITAGSFSPDHSHLLVGLADGSIRIHSSAPYTTDCDATPANTDYADILVEPITFISARIVPEEEPYAQAANDLLASGEIAIYPGAGAMKGPCYEGPYAAWARTHAEPNEIATAELDPDVLADQLHPQQWQKGLEAGGTPTVAARERQDWLQHYKAAQSKLATQTSKRVHDRPRSTETPLATPRKRHAGDRDSPASTPMDTTNTSLPTPRLSSPSQSIVTPTRLSPMQESSMLRRLEVPGTPSRREAAAPTPLATGSGSSTSNQILRAFPIRTPSPTAVRIKSNPDSPLRSQDSENASTRPKPVFRIPRPTPESPFRDRIAARAQAQQSAQAAAQKAEVIVLDDSD